MISNSMEKLNCISQVWFQNRRAKCRKHESQHYKSMSPQSFLPVNNNNNNSNSSNSKSNSILSPTSRNVTSSSIGVTVGETTSNRLELSDLKRKLNVASPEKSLVLSTKTSRNSSTSSLMSALEKSPATSFKLETTTTPIQSQSLMQSSSMSAKSKRLPDYRRLVEPSHIFNPLQVSKKYERPSISFFATRDCYV